MEYQTAITTMTNWDSFMYQHESISKVNYPVKNGKKYTVYLYMYERKYRSYLLHIHASLGIYLWGMHSNLSLVNILVSNGGLSFRK